MTNEMLSVNGLKYIFDIIEKSRVDDYVEYGYNTLILIARQNEMISFMLSFNVNNIILDNMKNDYNFIIYVLTLFRTLLNSNDYLKSQKSFVEFRRLFDLLAAEDDEEMIDLVLECLLALIDKNSFFTKSINKISSISVLSQLLRSNQENYAILKKAGKIYVCLISDLETEHIGKYYKQELPKILEIIGRKRFNENRFNRAIRIVNKIVPLIVDYGEFDEKVILSLFDLFENYEQIEI